MTDRLAQATELLSSPTPVYLTVGTGTPVKIGELKLSEAEADRLLTTTHLSFGGLLDDFLQSQMPQVPDVLRKAADAFERGAYVLLNIGEGS